MLRGVGGGRCEAPPYPDMINLFDRFQFFYQIDYVFI
jgi:hypothetical protein